MDKKWVNEHPIQFLLCMLTPIAIITFLGKEWQIVAIFLIATIIFGVFNGLGEFDVFKITKEGIELKRTVKEAKVTLEEISQLSITMLKMNLKQTLKLGNFDGLQAIKEYNFYKIYFEKIAGNDEELDEQFTEYKKLVLHNISFDLLRTASEYYVRLSGNYKNLPQELKELHAIIESLNKDDKDIRELEFDHNYFYEFDFLKHTISKELSIFESLKNDIDSLDDKYVQERLNKILNYMIELKKELEKVK
ncbi:hypothetical protein QUO84_001729 [Enterococcus faecium]|nr:hypothetical protein [Enterococcus faecium]